MFSVSILGVILAAVACFIIGFLFHGPFLGKLWMKLADIHPTGNEKFSDMTGQMISNLVSNLVVAYVLAVLINLAASSSLTSGAGLGTSILVGIILWVAVSAASSMEVIWMGRKIPLWIFELGSSLVCFIAMAIVLTFV